MYKVWVTVERLENPDTEDEKYEDIIMPVQLGHVSNIADAIELVRRVEACHAGSMDD